MPSKNGLLKISTLPILLKQPILVPLYSVSGNATEAELKKIYKIEGDYIHEQRLKKLKALQDFYSIHPATSKDWQRLIMRLACDFIPGFCFERDEKKRGRDRAWSTSFLYMLWYEVQEKMEKGEPSALNACRSIIKSQPWTKLLKPASGNGGPSHKSLYERYLQAKKCSVVRDVIQAGRGLSYAEQHAIKIGMYEAMCMRAFRSERKVTGK